MITQKLFSFSLCWEFFSATHSVFCRICSAFLRERCADQAIVIFHCCQDNLKKGRLLKTEKNGGGRSIHECAWNLHFPLGFRCNWFRQYTFCVSGDFQWSRKAHTHCEERTLLFSWCSKLSGWAVDLRLSGSSRNPESSSLIRKESLPKKSVGIGTCNLSLLERPCHACGWRSFHRTAYTLGANKTYLHCHVERQKDATHVVDDDEPGRHVPGFTVAHVPGAEQHDAQVNDREGPYVHRRVLQQKPVPRRWVWR